MIGRDRHVPSFGELVDVGAKKRPVSMVWRPLLLTGLMWAAAGVAGLGDARQDLLEERRVVLRAERLPGEA